MNLRFLESIRTVSLRHLGIGGVLLGLMACGSPKKPVENHKTFDDFKAVLVSGDYSAIAKELHPEVLKGFRQRLEFSVLQSREGSWFSGSRERQPTTDELKALSDEEFFVRYLRGESEVIGNPLIDRYRDAEVIAATGDGSSFSHFVTKGSDVRSRPTTFSFVLSDGRWLLMSPSVVEEFATQVRRAKGGSGFGGEIEKLAIPVPPSK